MKEHTMSNEEDIKPNSKMVSLYKLTKPGITLYVMLTAGVSHYVASQGNVIYPNLFQLLLGIELGSAGALSLNQ